MSRFGFDACTHVSETSDAFSGLRDRGFNLYPKTKDHPGGYQCRFIFFENRKPQSNAVQCCTQYMEFVESTDPSSASEYYRSVGSDDFDKRLSVLYFSYSENLEHLFEDKAQKFANYGITFLHKNYAWKEDSTTRSPGWNFITFKKDVVPGIHCSFAEYEHLEGSKRVESEHTSHPNGAYKILGTVWNIRSFSELASFSELTSLCLDDDRIRLHDETTIWTDLYDRLPQQLKSKNPSIRAVVIACLNYDHTKKIAHPDYEIDFFGSKAGVIRLPGGSWDIILLES